MTGIATSNTTNHRSSDAVAIPKANYNLCQCNSGAADLMQRLSASYSSIHACAAERAQARIPSLIFPRDNSSQTEPSLYCEPNQIASNLRGTARSGAFNSLSETSAFVVRACCWPPSRYAAAIPCSRKLSSVVLISLCPEMDLTQWVRPSMFKLYRIRPNDKSYIFSAQINCRRKS